MKDTAKHRRASKSGSLLDERDVAILHALEQNPGGLLKDLPKVIEDAGGPRIPYGTIQKRVKKLTPKFITRDLSVNWVKVGYLVRYRVGILIDPTALRDSKLTAGKYSSQPSLAKYIRNVLSRSGKFKNKLVVEDVFILLGGRVDLAVDFYSKDDKTATQFIIDALRNLPGVRDTVSAKLAYSSKHGWLSENGDEEEVKEGGNIEPDASLAASSSR